MTSSQCGQFETAQTLDSEIMISIEHPQALIKALDWAIAKFHRAFHRAVQPLGSDTDWGDECLFEPFVALSVPMSLRKPRWIWTSPERCVSVFFDHVHPFDAGTAFSPSSFLSWLFSATNRGSADCAFTPLNP